MPALLDIITPHLDESAVRLIGERTGIGRNRVRAAVSAVLPLVVGALARTANESRSAARSLERVVEGYGDQELSAVMSAADTDTRDEVLSLVFPHQQRAVVRGLEAALDVPTRQATRLLEVLSRLLLVGLAHARECNGLNEDKLASLLNRERGELERAVRGRPRPRLLDFLDGNGEQVVDEVAATAAAARDAGVTDLLFGSHHVG